MNVLEEIENEINYNYTDFCNLRHLIHYFEGYRSYTLDIDNPYSKGSARYDSFKAGHQKAQEDRIRIL